MLQVSNISFSYTDEKTISNFSFSLERGKCLAVIGESGCGKSTLLKLIYGLYDLSEGHIWWNENEVLGPKYNLIPGMDNMKYLAQDFDLMPFITVAENVGKYLSSTNNKAKNGRITELLELVEMSEYANVKVQFLSGGQMQRVAIARVLALEPELILFDEPFSHIDSFRKNNLRRKVFQYLKEKGITCIVATHDSKDVLSYSDQTLVVKDGKVVANGITEDVYQDRSSHYVVSLFDDTNELLSTDLGLDGVSRVMYLYPHELKMVLKSNLEVEVVASYFKGNGYLISSIFKGKLVLFENEKALAAKQKVCLVLS